MLILEGMTKNCVVTFVAMCTGVLAQKTLPPGKPLEFLIGDGAASHIGKQGGYAGDRGLRGVLVSSC